MNEIVRCGDPYWTKAGKPKSTGASTTHGGSRLCTLPCDDTPTLADVLAGFARIERKPTSRALPGPQTECRCCRPCPRPADRALLEDFSYGPRLRLPLSLPEVRMFMRSACSKR